MPYYRCYFFHDGHVAKAEDGDHPDDSAALVWAAELHRSAPHFSRIEVWQGQRLVLQRRGPDG